MLNGQQPDWPNKRATFDTGLAADLLTPDKHQITWLVIGDWSAPGMLGTLQPLGVGPIQKGCLSHLHSLHIAMKLSACVFHQKVR
jgi:hypothetical protein